MPSEGGFRKMGKRKTGGGREKPMWYDIPLAMSVPDIVKNYR